MTFIDLMLCVDALWSMEILLLLLETDYECYMTRGFVFLAGMGLCTDLRWGLSWSCVCAVMQVCPGVPSWFYLCLCDSDGCR